jgi:hypothetical protein
VSDEIEHGFKEGDKVWVEDGDGKHHPGIFVADNESSGWFGGGPSAYVVHPEAKQAEVCSHDPHELDLAQAAGAAAVA